MKDGEDVYDAKARMKKMNQRINYHHNLKAVRELNQDANIYLWTNAPEAVNIYLYNATKLVEKSDIPLPQRGR